MNKLLIVLFALFAIAIAIPVQQKLLSSIQKIKEIESSFGKTQFFFRNVRQAGHDAHLNNKIEMNSILKRSQNTRTFSPSCVTALLELNNTINNVDCQTKIGIYFNEASTLDQRTTAVNGYCGTCFPLAQQAVQNVIGNCAIDINDPHFEYLHSVGFAARFLCTQDNGVYCANTLATVEATVQSKTNFYSFTETDLNSICTPCVFKAVQTLIQSDNVDQSFIESFVALRGVCVKLEGKYCVLSLNRAFDLVKKVIADSQGNNIPPASDFEPLLDIFCSPCFHLVVSRLSIAKLPGDALPSVPSGLENLCRKNPAKEYCFIKLYNIFRDVFSSQNVPCDLNVTSTCTQECKSFVANIIQKGGCCWELLVDFATEEAPGAYSRAKQAYIDYIKSCDTSLVIPAGCPSYAQALITVSYTNINTDWINANIDSFLSSSLEDLQINIGGGASFGVPSLNTNKRANSAEVTVQCNVTGTAAGVYGSTNDAVCQNSCNNPANPAQNVGYSTRSSNIVVVSSASIVSFALILVALLFIAIF